MTTPNSPTPPTPPPPTAPPSGAQPPRRSRLIVWCVVAGVAIVVGVVAIRYFAYRSSHSITDDAFVEARIVNIAPEMVSGIIVKFHVEENDRVEQGQVL